MDIALMSMVLSQSAVHQQASMSVMKMAMGSVEQHGQAIQQLIGAVDAATIQHEAQPHLGGNIDLKL